ncbi:MAG: hypothetical protein LBQ55_06665 [Treponema sp.]|nr:hypothetical protein [Treponema sp.]
MVLELPPGAEEKDFIPRIEKILSALGSVCFLSPRSCLVMVPDNIDSELLAHRLSKSLGVKALHHFRADTSGGAMEQLAPYR